MVALLQGTPILHMLDMAWVQQSNDNLNDFPKLVDK